MLHLSFCWKGTCKNLIRPVSLLWPPMWRNCLELCLFGCHLFIFGLFKSLWICFLRQDPELTPEQVLNSWWSSCSSLLSVWFHVWTTMPDLNFVFILVWIAEKHKLHALLHIKSTVVVEMIWHKNRSKWHSVFLFVCVCTRKQEVSLGCSSSEDVHIF